MHICFMSTITTGEEEWKGIKEEKKIIESTQKRCTRPVLPLFLSMVTIHP